MYSLWIVDDLLTVRAGNKHKPKVYQINPANPPQRSKEIVFVVSLSMQHLRPRHVVLGHDLHRGHVQASDSTARRHLVALTIGHTCLSANSFRFSLPNCHPLPRFPRCSPSLRVPPALRRTPPSELHGPGAAERTFTPKSGWPLLLRTL